METKQFATLTIEMVVIGAILGLVLSGFFFARSRQKLAVLSVQDAWNAYRDRNIGQAIRISGLFFGKGDHDEVRARMLRATIMIERKAHAEAASLLNDGLTVLTRLLEQANEGSETQTQLLLELISLKSKQAYLQRQRGNLTESIELLLLAELIAQRLQQTRKLKTDVLIPIFQNLAELFEEAAKNSDYLLASNQRENARHYRLLANNMLKAIDSEVSLESIRDRLERIFLENA